MKTGDLQPQAERIRARPARATTFGQVAYKLSWGGLLPRDGAVRSKRLKNPTCLRTWIQDDQVIEA